MPWEGRPRSCRHLGPGGCPSARSSRSRRPPPMRATRAVVNPRDPGWSYARTSRISRQTRPTRAPRAERVGSVVLPARGGGSHRRDRAALTTPRICSPAQATTKQGRHWPRIAPISAEICGPAQTVGPRGTNLVVSCPPAQTVGFVTNEPMTIGLEFHPLARVRLPDLAVLFVEGGDPNSCLERAQ